MLFSFRDLGRRDIRDDDLLRKVEQEIADVLRDVAWGRASWQDVSRLLGEALPGSAVSIVNYNAETGSLASAFVDGIAPDYVRSYLDHYVSLDPWIEFWRKAPSWRLFLSERDSPARHFRASEFYTDWMRPQGNVEAAAGIRIEADAVNAVHVSWHYDLSRAATYDAPAATLLERLRPMLEASVRDAAIVRDALQVGNRLGTVIKHVEGAAYLVDQDGTIREANQDASTELHKGDVVQGLGGVLTLRDIQVQRWFDETVARLLNREPASSTSLVFAVGSRVYRLIVSLLPGQLAASSTLLISPRPMMLVVLQLLVGGRLRIDDAALKIAFGLSAAEIRLCEELINGNSLASAARKLGLSDGTVRQRVKMIFHKTHTHRQGELIAALGRFAAPE